MKPTELRIGNYVWDNYSGKMIVRLVASDYIYLSKTVDLPLGEYLPKNVKPVLLTKNWLEKAGAQLNAVMGSTEAIWFIDNIEIPKWIKHVHELQNWYYWKFMKTELKINEI